MARKASPKTFEIHMHSGKIHTMHGKDAAEAVAKLREHMKDCPEWFPPYIGYFGNETADDIMSVFQVTKKHRTDWN